MKPRHLVTLAALLFPFAEGAAPPISPDDTLAVEALARTRCAERWPGASSMAAACVEDQLEGLLQLQQMNTASSVRQACAGRWPEDFAMRATCEAQGQTVPRH
jgi:hypothetical protein